MNLVFLILALVSPLSGYGPADPPTIRSSDLRVLVGNEWKGTLTYLDYTSKKITSIPSNVRVRPMQGREGSWVFEYRYPDEPKANGSDTVTVSDDGKKALIRHTYVISAKTFSVIKEVRFETAGEFIERNRYSWTR